MLRSGLVSVTFRDLSPERIVKLVAQAGLDAIEWGGDVHVPHGELEVARDVAAMTRDAGCEVAAYGSYYRLGCEIEQGFGFAAVLDTALELGTKTIRVWAGDRGTAEADEAWWATVVGESRRIAALSAAAGVAIAYEFHGGTLTDSADSAVRLLKTVARENVFAYWQADTKRSAAERLSDLRKVGPWLKDLHVFHWEAGQRMALEDGEAEWRTYLEYAASTGRGHYALIEFVKDGAPECFLRDAATLKRWLSS